MDDFPEKADNLEDKVTQKILLYKLPIMLSLTGIILVGLAVIYLQPNLKANKVEVIEQGTTTGELVVEVAGAVEKPGVYKLAPGARVADALKSAGGVSEEADRALMEKLINQASKLTDGQKIYIPKHSQGGTDSNTGGYQSVSGDQTVSFSKMVNINTASPSQLENLWGIGPVTAQKIVEQRPYSSVEELLSKSILKKNVFDANKDLLTVY